MALAATQRVRLLRPLRHRDFGLLWAGMSISIVGDGFYQVALAWQVYLLSDSPTALSIVGPAVTLPHVAFVLFVAFFSFLLLPGMRRHSDPRSNKAANRGR